MKKKKNDFRISIGIPYPFGATVLKNGVNFAISLPGEEKCKLNLYDKNTGELIFSVFLTEENRTGNVFHIFIQINTPKKRLDQILGSLESNLNLKDCAYLYQIREKEFIDPYAKIIYGREYYGLKKGTKADDKIFCGIYSSEFNWEEEKSLQIPLADLFLYKFHMRGFTKHISSQIPEKGTFAGAAQKIPYLKELGINGVQLMPIYEYNEILPQIGMGITDKINYWGYSEDNAYFAPKTSYASNTENASLELKNMIQAFHLNGIEVIMEMNFTAATNQLLILECLRYWSSEYHVDGFKLSGENVPYVLLATDPLLGKTKLFAEGWDIDKIYGKESTVSFRNLAEYNVGYSIDARRFLRGDEEQVGGFAYRFARNPEKYGIINYITNHDGFTLMDLYSFDEKHNEKNGENNRDGADYNFSWNCGSEGRTRIRKVVQLRKKMIRNTLAVLFLSQGTPLLLAGDEFGNSQSGNNNAYCQDNEISWLDWSGIENNKDIVTFVKQLIKLRKEHPILHMERPFKNMDYISCGVPDISFHSAKAWYPDYSHYSRMLGVMLAGNYVLINRKEKENSFYFIFNMYWEKRGFDLPSLSEGLNWYLVLDTDGFYRFEEVQLLDNQRLYEAAARSIVVLIGK